MLKIIAGGAGSGVTDRARELACELAAKGERPIMLVPEQFSFESERAMLRLLGAKDARLVEVYSFTRLAEELSRTSGGSAGKRLDDCGRVAAMGMALSELGDRLELYRGKRSTVFIEHLLDAVKEFKVCAVSPEQLESAAAKADGLLRRKLGELSLIYSAYDAIVSRTALDPLDDLGRLYRRLAENRFFCGRTVIIDAFRGFTGAELRVISRVIEQSELCVVTLCADCGPEGDASTGLFATTVETMRSLVGAAKEAGVPVDETEILTHRPHITSDALLALERGLLRTDADFVPHEAPTDDVTVFFADSRFSEAEYAARECRRLLREEGYRCRDIAIIARSADNYAELVADALELQELPCFLDRRVDAAVSAPMQLVTAALGAVAGMRTDDMLRVVRTGLVSGISREDAAELENYCFVWEIKGQRWSSPFTENPDGFAPAMTDAQAERLGRINSARGRAASLISRLSEKMRGSGADMAAAVYDMLEQAGTPAMLTDLCSRLPEARAEELVRIWDALMNILDQLASILGKASIPRDSFADLLTLMINRCDIGHIPQGLDEITFGAADRIRVSSPRAVFVLGAADGEFPAIPSGTGVFTDDERKRLRGELELPVAEPLERRLLEEQLLVYTTFCSPSERLYVCCPPSADRSSAEENPSECVAEVLRCVPGAAKARMSRELSVGDVESAAAAFELAARHIGDNTPLSASLTAEANAREAHSGKIRAVREMARGALPSLGASASERAKAMFGETLSISPSSLETYHRCPFEFLCRYGMGLKPLRRAKLDPLQGGTVVHYVLERILSEFDDYESMAEDEGGVRMRVTQLLEQYLDEEMGGTADKSGLTLFRLRKMADSLTFVVLSCAAELAGGEFKPDGFELTISGGGDIEPETIISPEGRSARITGKIDRVDRCGDMIRVIDYKTGGKAFTLSDVLDGLNMQMLIYLGALCSSDKFRGMKPAGIVYVPAFSKAVSVGRQDGGDAVEKERGKELCRSVMIIDDSEDASVARSMEPPLAGRFIPVRLKKDGTPDAKSAERIQSEEGYDLIRRYIRRVIGRMTDETLSGHLPPSPVQKGNGSSECGNCDYADICRYTGAKKWRRSLNSQDTLAEMKKRMEEDDNA